MGSLDMPCHLAHARCILVNHRLLHVWMCRSPGDIRKKRQELQYMRALCLDEHTKRAAIESLGSLQAEAGGAPKEVSSFMRCKAR